MLGMPLGAIYGLLVAGFIGAVFGAPFGAIAGTGLGLLQGVVMAVFTVAAFSHVWRAGTSNYRVAMGLLSVLTIVLPVVVLILPQALSSAGLSNGTGFFYVIPGFIAAIASWFASGSVAGWVEWKMVYERGTAEQHQGGNS